MKEKLYILVGIGLLIVLLPISCSRKENITISGRNQDEDKTSAATVKQPNINKTNNQENIPEYGSWTSFGSSTVVVYSRLYYQNFIDILNDNTYISDIYIIYHDWSREDQNYNILERKDFDISGGYSWKSIMYSDINTFEGSYGHFFEGVTPHDAEPLTHNFTRDEMNVLFNYLKEGDNPAYFFSGTEFEGKPDPYESDSFSLCEGKYVFVLKFGKPNEGHHYSWGICKCCDDPTTDQAFQGLIGIMEDHFISHF